MGHYCIRTDSEHERPVLTADMRCYFCGQSLAPPEPEPEPESTEVAEELTERERHSIRLLEFKGLL